MPLPVILRALARQNVDAAVAHYATEAGPELALRFVDALEQALGRLADSPSMGSPRYGYELGIEGLRAWPLRHFPWLVFYRHALDQADVWRVLHAHRDVPAWLAEPQQDGLAWNEHGALDF